MKTACLFIHAGKTGENRADILIMPVGLIPLAGFLTKNGFKSLVFNHTLSLYKSGGQGLNAVIKKNDPQFLCLDLHWHFQIRDVIQLVRELKKSHPGRKILLGGFTASFFAEEIMREVAEADFVVKGDSEIPLLALCQAAAKGKKDLSGVPNLLHRKDGRVIVNRQTYTINRKIFDSLFFSDFRTVINPKDVQEGNWSVSVQGGKKTWDDQPPAKPRAFYSLSRGCVHNCAFCGGAAEAQKRINNRAGVIVKSHASALRDIKGFMKAGVKNFTMCGLTGPYGDFFRYLAGRKVTFTLRFETCELPSIKFLRSFAAAFKDDLGSSHIKILLHKIASESNAGTFSGNASPTAAQLYRTLDAAKALSINTGVSFTLGLPHGTNADFRLIREAGRTIMKRYGFFVSLYLNVLEPGAPMYLHPDKYGVKLTNPGFRGYLEHAPSPDNPGYKSGCMSAGQMIKHQRSFNDQMKKLRAEGQRRPGRPGRRA